MKICRIYDYPREDFPGAGLAGYYYSRKIVTPTLYLTKKERNLFDIPSHVDLRAFSYSNPAYGEEITFFKTLGKVAGLGWFFLRCLWPMAKFRPDLIHIHSPLYAAQAAFCKYFLGAATFQTFHGSGLLRVKRSKLLKKALLSTIDLFFYVSENMRSDLESFVPSDRLVYTPNGVDLEKFRDLSLERRKRIVAVGTLRWQKGYEHLLEAMSALRDREYTLTIVGDGPLRNELGRKAEELGIVERVDFAGAMGQRELIEILNTSSIYVMSSVSEGFPKAVIEAMACGLPVVLTDTGSCSALSAGAGICVPPAAPAPLAEALDKLISDSALRKEYAAGAREAAKRYSWDTPAGIVLENYEKLLPGKKIS